MMSERERLKEARVWLKSLKEDDYERMKKENVLEDLIASTNKETGKLTFPIVVPIYEHNMDFLIGILTGFGYKLDYEKEYNYFFSTTCYTVSLKA